MGKILETIGLFAGIIPLILTLIKQFETPGFGPEKKQAVLDIIEAFYDNLNITSIEKEKVLGISETIIDIAVKFFNLIGWFKHSDPTTPS